MKSLLKFLLPHLLVLLGLIIVCFFVNKIPNGYMIASGDFYELVNYQNDAQRYLYLWFHQNGQGNFNPLVPAFPFYFLLSFVSQFLGSNAISSFLMVFLLFSSYLSFYISSIFLKFGKKLAFLGALLYALNNFSVSLFAYSWGFTHHLLFYIFIPPLIVLPIVYILEGSKRTLAVFALFFIVSQMAYANVAFLAVLIFVNILVYIFLILFKIIRFDRFFVLRILHIIAIVFIIFSWYIVPFYLANSYISGLVSSTKVLGGDLGSWIKNTSITSPLELFGMILEKGRNLTFENIYSNTLIQSVSLFYGLVMLLFLFSKRPQRNEKQDHLWLVFLSVFLVILILALRAYGIFESFGLWIYQLPGFNIFRSPDKIFSVIPFLYVMVFISLFRLSKIRDVYKVSLCIFLLLIPLPFYIGNTGVFLQKESPSVMDPRSSYSQAIKIPDVYYSAAGIINKDSKDGRIISLPYSVVNSINWVNYPKWHFVGHDILHMLFSKEYTYANCFDHMSLETQLSFKNFNEQGGSPENLLRILKKFSGEYILYHYDIEPYWIGKSKHIEDTLKDLAIKGYLTSVTKNDYFELFRIKDDEITPKIDVSQSKKVDFDLINPTQYTIVVHGIIKTSIVTFLESFNPEWKLYLEPYSPLDCTPIATYTGSTIDSSPSKSLSYIGTGTLSSPTLLQKQETEPLAFSVTKLKTLGVTSFLAEIQKLFPAKIEIPALKESSYHTTECKPQNTFYAGGELSKLWQKPVFDDTHKLVYDYANQWTIGPEYIKANYPKSYYQQNPDGTIDVRMTLYFRPQSYFYLGLIISGTTLILLVGYLGWSVVRRRKNENEK